MNRSSSLKSGSLVILLSLIVAAPATADPLHDIKEVRHFAEEVVIGPKPGARLVKWTEAPVIRLETLKAGPHDSVGKITTIPTETSMLHYNALQEHIADLALMTGMPMRLMPRDFGSGGDIVITIVPRQAMSTVPFPGVPAKMLNDLMGPSRCFFVIWPNPDWAIARAQIVINSLLDDIHIKHCLLEELTQSLGLPNDSDRLRPSVFNESAMLTVLSGLDRLLIRTVYDPRISKGLSLGAFRERADAVIAGYLKRPDPD
ncbi:MAG: DUF2927 domain-containing protein [Rhodospirillales bacterium]